MLCSTKFLQCEPSAWCFKILDKILSGVLSFVLFLWSFYYCFPIAVVVFCKILQGEPSEWCFKILGKIFMLVIIFSTSWLIILLFFSNSRCYVLQNFAS